MGLDRHRVSSALVVAVIAISFAAIFFRKADPTHPLVTAGSRLVLAAVILAPWTLRAFARGRMRGSVGWTAVSCGLAYAVHFGAWVTSLTLTSVAASVTLVTATPLMLALAALASGRDRAERRHWIAIGLALTGLLLIGGADLGSSSALIGDALALVGAAAMAVYMLLVRRLGDQVDPGAFTGAAAAVGGVVLLVAAYATGVPLRFASNEALFYVVLAALVPQIIGHTLLTWALRHAKPTAIGIATVGEPVGSTLLGWLWLGDRAGPVTLLGCVITIGAVAIAMRPPRGATPESTPS